MSKNTTRRTLSAASIGNFGELYDFAVFGFSVPFIAAHFFPGGDTTAAVLNTFAVYAVAFFARPVGGLMFGYLLDSIGRVKVLAITIWLMAGGTAIIGLLPTYESIGIAAPALLVACRFAQGLAVGGETTGSTSFVIESAPDKKRGLWVGIVYFFGNIPNAFVAFMLIGMQLLIGKEAYLEWAWRIPFLLGGLIGIVGYWVRRNLEDPEEYKQATRKDTSKTPLRALTRSGLKSILCVSMIMSLQSVASYYLLGFTYTFLVKQAGLESKMALLSNAIAIAAYAATIPIGGALSDRFGRKAVLTGGALWIALVAWLSIRLAANGTLPEAILGQVLIAIGIGFYGSATFVASAEFFPTSFRATGHAIAYQATVAIMGGTSPLVCAWLVRAFQSPLAPGWYVTVVAAVTVIAIRFIPETKDVDLRTSIEGITSNRPSEIPARTTGSHGKGHVRSGE
ncbi:Predicted arabinose efflux permease, MFS family [Caballeronia arationis]|uniref:Predicted arabinose efflux permease, MFS family n=1 Tax=Caballeronia arationis TaxID=1777142 RepID=A0A7Z7I0Y3_9BURK|nr:MFS transporter [Caballeronia arationis]SOE46452.1 Predicted arabinose efflux permease, MFS family [Caballeronia arationis]